MSIANLITRTFTGAAAAAILAFGFSAGAAAADKVIHIGVTPVPHADIVNFIKPQLEKEGVKLEVVEFNDYVQPNLALDSKDLDANYFQTIPYLEEFVKQHNFKLEPAQLPRSLDDVAAAVINANYALQAGLNPAHDSIALEAKSSPFGNVVVVRDGDEAKPEFQKLKAAITSPEVKKFIEEKYKGGVIPVF